MKKLLILLMALVMTVFPLAACGNGDDNVIRINEVTHSIFYAPLYAAQNLGYFEEENLKIELTNGGGSDKISSAYSPNRAVSRSGSVRNPFDIVRILKAQIVIFLQSSQNASSSSSRMCSEKKRTKFFDPSLYALSTAGFFSTSASSGVVSCTRLSRFCVLCDAWKREISR